MQAVFGCVGDMIVLWHTGGDGIYRSSGCVAAEGNWLHLINGDEGARGDGNGCGVKLGDSGRE